MGTCSGKVGVGLSVTITFSRRAGLLVLSRTADNLSPVVESRVLSVFLRFVRSRRRSVLISSRVADSLRGMTSCVIFVRGKGMLFSGPGSRLVRRCNVVGYGTGRFSRLGGGSVVHCEGRSCRLRILITGERGTRGSCPRTLIMPTSVSSVVLLCIGKRR